MIGCLFLLIIGVYLFPFFRPVCGRRDYFSALKGGGGHPPWPVRKNTLDSRRGRFFRDPTGRMPALAGMETGGYLC